MKKVLTFGEAMGLLIAEDTGNLDNVNLFSKQAAGAELNVAIGLARLGFDMSYVTSFGNDPLGRYLKSFIDSENVNSKYITFSNTNSTGLMFKEKVENGADPFVASFRRHSAASAYNVEEAKKVDIASLDLLHCTGIFLALSKTTLEAATYFKNTAKENGVTVTFDPNLRESLWESREVMVKTINEFAKGCDYVLPGISEGEILTGSSEPSEIADFYINLGAKCVIIKLGAKGGYYKTSTGEEGFVDGFKVEKVVDTVGAGDGFAVGCISGILDGCDTTEVVRRGTAIGAIQVMSKGDNSGLPTREQLTTFMNK